MEIGLIITNQNTTTKNIINHKMESNNRRNSWRDVTIREYFELVEDINDEALQEYEKEVKIIAFANRMDEYKVWSLKLNEFRALQVEKTWMNEFNISQKVKFSKITIDGEKYKVDTNLQTFTIAQYIDFQTFWPKKQDEPKYIGNVLACFLIPEGKEYAEGYDTQALATKIYECLDILTANEIMFFFLKQYLLSMRVTANFLNYQIKKLKKMKSLKSHMMEIEKQWEMTKIAMLEQVKSIPSTSSVGFHLLTK